MRLRSWLLLALLSGCGGGEVGPDAAPPRASYSPVDTDGRRFLDAEGRTVILRGVNARVEGIFDVTFDDGRIALEPIPPLTAADCVRMRELGFNLLRLPINWSGLEPERDVFDETYLAAVDAAVQCAADAGVYVLIDMHQDAYSKEIGEDGAPLWAIEPPPTMLLEGPLEDLGDRRLSEQVLAAFDGFFAPADANGLQAELADALAYVAARFADDPAVVGFELFNEPVGDSVEIDAFHVRAATRVRAAAPGKLIFFEPNSIRNLVDFAAIPSDPFPVAGAVYAPHVYTYVFSDPSNQLDTATIEDLRPSVDNAAFEAQAWGAPLFIGEFGFDPASPNFAKWVGLELDLQDEYAASSAFWVWKEESQGSWGLFTRTMTGWDERPDTIAVLSRPYAERIAGAPTTIRWDATAGTLTVAYDDAVDAANVLFVPERFTVASASCDGQATTPMVAARLVSLSCGQAGAHTVVLTLN